MALWECFWSQIPHLVEKVKLNVLLGIDKGLSRQIHLLCSLQLVSSEGFFGCAILIPMEVPDPQGWGCPGCPLTAWHVLHPDTGNKELTVVQKELN